MYRIIYMQIADIWLYLALSASCMNNSTDKYYLLKL